MKQFIKTILNKLILVCVFASLFQACSSDDGTVSCVPNTTVRASINPNLIEFADLNSRNWVYLNGPLTGTRGLIVVKTASGYKAFDRNAPHICPGDKTTLVVKNDWIIECEADGAKWMLTGSPIEGTKADRPMKDYRVEVINGTIFISNF
ncbi:hypothetical protein [Empedobacter brevis]|uniref:hypothetical protein n=1 Tax=Empedobacter brevis TaxID=247 RepID=UPI0039AF0C89